jgi:hypothetical protein
MLEKEVKSTKEEDKVLSCMSASFVTSCQCLGRTHILFLGVG